MFQFERYIPRSNMDIIWQLHIQKTYRCCQKVWVFFGCPVEVKISQLRNGAWWHNSWEVSRVWNKAKTYLDLWIWSKLLVNKWSPLYYCTSAHTVILLIKDSVISGGCYFPSFCFRSWLSWCKTNQQANQCDFLSWQISELSKSSVRIGDPQKVEQILNAMKRAGPNSVQVQHPSLLQLAGAKNSCQICTRFF